ncbi:DUF2268 domain-containing protein [Luteimonas panaciterrae]|uniref:DUF2268 domain-containing protein n=1 Tax=Luteimonas panaciterrae TaxID=363885 RepID=UPI001CF9FD1E|nr:DUF2268 domain-containing protein [Luteimonas panaciterrae]
MRWGLALWVSAWMGLAPVQAENGTGLAESTDIDRFWQAYDQVRAERSLNRQRELLQRKFVDPGTAGLHAFMQTKGYDTDCYVNAIRRYPRFWESVRSRTLAMRARSSEFEPAIARLRTLYPALRPAKIYFLIGCLRSSGTTLGDKVLIGAELAAGDRSVDISELPMRLRKSLGVYFASEPEKQLVLLNVHEYIHTQQRGPGKTLLAQAMYEGAADFVAEQVIGRTPALPYMQYGYEHEATLKQEFRSEMDGVSWSNWLYNGPGNHHGVGDLGYYVGYAIMRDYYAQAPDKAKAVREIIELDYRDQAAVERFAATSGFFNR